MVIRVAAKLATKLHFTPAKSKPPEPNPYADWTAHLFTADRTQYILVSNTTSLYSMVLYGAGITSDDRFVDWVFQTTRTSPERQCGSAAARPGRSILATRCP